MFNGRVGKNINSTMDIEWVKELIETFIRINQIPFNQAGVRKRMYLMKVSSAFRWRHNQEKSKLFIFHQLNTNLIANKPMK